MNATKNIREALDLTQSQLAIYLGVSRSRLALAETHRRELPTSALLKLGALERYLHKNVSPGQQQVLSEKDSSAMRRHAAFCAHKARVAKLELETLQRKYQCCVQALAAIDHLRSNLPQGKETRKDQLWLEWLQAVNIKKLRKCGPAAQFKIKLNLKALEMQAEEAGKAGN